MRPVSISIRITMIYLVVGVLWILISDELLKMVSNDPAVLMRIAVVKGWCYVAATALMLYVLIRRGASHIQRSEEEARATEAKYRQLVENANSIIMRRDPSGRITYLNEFAQDFFGYDRDDILGRNVVGTIVPEVDGSGRDLKGMIVDIGKNPEKYANNANENMRRDGERVWIAWTNKPIRDEHGRIVEVLCIGNDITARKRAEEVLQRYELLAGHSRDIILFMQRDDGRILEANVAATKAYGCSRDELLSLTIHDLCASEMSELTADQLEEADNKGTLFETVHRRKDGGTFPVEVSVRGETIGGTRTLLSVIRDITQRKKAEAEIREHEERLRLAMEATQQGWFDLNVQTGEVTVSPEYVRIIGFEPADFKTNLQDWLDGIHPEECDIVVKAYKECLEAGDTKTMEYRRRTKTGEWKWIRSIGKIVGYDSQNRPLRMTGTHTDISERKQVEEALRESQERFRELAELLPETVFEMDASGNLTFVNRSAFDHFGISLEDFERGLNCFDFILEEDRPRARQNARRVMNGEKIGLNEYTVLRSDGTTFPAILHTSAKVRDAQPVGLRGIVIDITETKKLEAKLRQAHKMEAVGTLAGGVAHDFNNLLQAVQGYAELLLFRKKEGEDGYRELLEIIRAARRGGDLTRQLLTFSRKVESKLQPVDLNRIVNDVRKLLERTIPRMIQIDLRPMGDLHRVNADASQMEQILVNLALNARDAMPEGGTLTVRTENVALGEEFRRSHSELNPGNYVLLSVTDTGLGMDKATQEHIFDPFFTTKEIGRGTGLGLAMVYGIVKNHFGYIACASNPGEGTTFYIYLPAIDQPEEVQAMVKEKKLRGGHETVLLVSDDESARELGEQTLQVYGYKVICAQDGELALNIHREKKDEIDLIILDLSISGSGAGECLAGLLEVKPQARIVLAGDHPVDGAAEGPPQGGATAFLNKPFGVQQLLKVVRELLD